jgi:cobalt-precorrin 5A hydrolase
MDMGEAMTVAGLGCARGVTTAEVLAAIEAARGGRHLDALATVPEKRHEPALVDAAGRLGLPLLVVDASTVLEARLATRSSLSLAATGSPSASEAAALAAAGPDARLLAPRLALGRVTCAIAGSEAAQ